MLTIGPEKALHLQVAERYRGLIRSGHLKPGERLPSVRALARGLGVSVTPVNVAFGVLEQEGLVCRRRGAGTFVGQGAAPQPAVLEIGVIFRPVLGWREDDNYLLRLFCGIQDALQAGGRRTSLVTFAREKGPPSDMPEQFLDRPPHGFVLEEGVSDEFAARLAATGRPAVIVDRESAAAGVSSVFRDTAQAGAEAARRALALGHRVAACVGHPSHREPQAMSGFLQALAEAGAAAPASRVATYTVREDGRGAFAKVMSAAAVPTVVYCASDRVARHFYKWAHEAGLRIPEDVSVIGTTDMKLAQLLDPPLTTFRFVPEEVGRAAVEEVIACCREPGRAPRAVAISGEWVERDSLAPPA